MVYFSTTNMARPEGFQGCADQAATSSNDRTLVLRCSGLSRRLFHLKDYDSTFLLMTGDHSDLMDPWAPDLQNRK